MIWFLLTTLIIFAATGNFNFRFVMGIHFTNQLLYFVVIVVVVVIIVVVNRKYKFTAHNTQIWMIAFDLMWEKN